jgi:hypothetical protein
LKISDGGRIVLDDPVTRDWFERRLSQACLDDHFIKSSTHLDVDDKNACDIDWKPTTIEFVKRMERKMDRRVLGALLETAGVENNEEKYELLKDMGRKEIRKLSKKALNELIGTEDADKVRAVFKDVNKAKADRVGEEFDFDLGLIFSEEVQEAKRQETMFNEMKKVVYKKDKTKAMAAENKERPAAQQEVDRLASIHAVPRVVLPPPPNVVPPPPQIVPENQMVDNEFNDGGHKGIEILNLNTNTEGKKEKTHVGYILSNELYPIQNQPGAITALKRKVYNAGLPVALKKLKKKQRKEQRPAEKKKRRSEDDSGAGASGGAGRGSSRR